MNAAGDIIDYQVKWCLGGKGGRQAERFGGESGEDSGSLCAPRRALDPAGIGGTSRTRSHSAAVRSDAVVLAAPVFLVVTAVQSRGSADLLRCPRNGLTARCSRVEV